MKTYFNAKHVICFMLFQAVVFLSTSFNTQASTVIGETGSVFTNQPNRDVWHKVELQHTYEEAVVVMNIVSQGGTQPVHPRVRNITSNSFNFQLEEWDYQDGLHVTEEIHYIVLESGKHTLSDGTLLQAQNMTATDQWATYKLSSEFGEAPVLLTQVVSNNEQDSVVTQQKVLSSTRFQLRLKEQEAGGRIGDGQSHAVEVVSYMAIEAGLGFSDGITYEVGFTESLITERPYSIQFEQSFSSAPLFFALANTSRGQNPFSIRSHDLNKFNILVNVEEEQSNDVEVEHNAEKIGYLVLESSGLIKILSLLYPNPKFPVGEDPYLVTTADVDNDGIIDILTTNIRSDDISVLLGGTDRLFDCRIAWIV